MIVRWLQIKTYLLHNLSLQLLQILKQVLKLIVYEYSAFLNFPEHIHKYIWNVVIEKFLSFQFFKTTFPKK